MDVSEVSKEDLPALSALYQQLIPNSCDISKMEQVLCSNQNNSNHMVLVAKDQGRVIGTLLSSCCEMLFGECKSFMVIEDVVVDEQYRRQGVGELLMRGAELHAKARNCSYIMLITDRDRVGSQRFYLSLGYQMDEYCAFKKHL